MHDTRISHPFPHKRIVFYKIQERYRRAIFTTVIKKEIRAEWAFGLPKYRWIYRGRKNWHHSVNSMIRKASRKLEDTEHELEKG